MGIPLGGLEIGSSSIPEHTVTVTNRFIQGSRHVIDLRVTIGPSNPTASLEPMSLPELPFTSSKKHTSVCCHWKNKGWCKYQSHCKFQHPLHKRGVGAAMPKLHNVCDFPAVCLNGQGVRTHFP